MSVSYQRVMLSNLQVTWMETDSLTETSRQNDSRPVSSHLACFVSVSAFPKREDSPSEKLVTAKR